MRTSIIEELKPRAVEFLRVSPNAVGVGDVAKHLDVTWGTGRQVLMELLLEGQVECERTVNARVFKAKVTESGEPVPDVRKWCGTSSK